MSLEKKDAFLRAMMLRLPGYWSSKGPHIGGFLFEHNLVQMRVILSVEKGPDDCAWVHFSMSRKDRLPSWEELKAAKEIFLGDVHAFQMLPPKAEYVNFHPNCLHLWHCLDRNPIPDFRKGESI